MCLRVVECANLPDHSFYGCFTGGCSVCERTRVPQESVHVCQCRSDGGVGAVSAGTDHDGRTAQRASQAGSVVTGPVYSGVREVCLLTPPLPNTLQLG